MASVSTSGAAAAPGRSARAPSAIDVRQVSFVDVALTARAFLEVGFEVVRGAARGRAASDFRSGDLRFRAEARDACEQLPGQSPVAGEMSSVSVAVSVSMSSAQARAWSLRVRTACPTSNPASQSG